MWQYFSNDAHSSRLSSTKETLKGTVQLYTIHDKQFQATAACKVTACMTEEWDPISAGVGSPRPDRL